MRNVLVLLFFEHCCILNSDKPLWHRYCPNTGLLTLTSEKYRDREENRLHIVDMLNDLVNEGQKMFPSETFKKSIDLRAALSEAQRVEAQSELETVAQ